MQEIIKILKTCFLKKDFLNSIFKISYFNKFLSQRVAIQQHISILHKSTLSNDKTLMWFHVAKFVQKTWVVVTCVPRPIAIIYQPQVVRHLWHPQVSLVWKYSNTVYRSYCKFKQFKLIIHYLLISNRNFKFGFLKAWPNFTTFLHKEVSHAIIVQERHRSQVHAIFFSNGRIQIIFRCFHEIFSLSRSQNHSYYVLVKKFFVWRP